MTEAEAMSCLGLLVGATNGWTEDTDVGPGSLTLYLEEFMAMSDQECLLAAVRDVLRTHTSTHRPPLVVVLDAYRSQLRLKQESRGALPAPSGQRYLSPDEGRPIALVAYRAECARLGREPNMPLFNSIFGEGRESRRRDEETRRAFRRVVW